MTVKPIIFSGPMKPGWLKIELQSAAAERARWPVIPVNEPRVIRDGEYLEGRARGRALREPP